MVHLAIRKSMKLKEAASTKWLSRYKTVWGLLHTVLQPSLTSSLEVGLVGRNVGAQVCDSVGWAEVASLAWIEDTLPYSRVVWYWPGENANGWWTLCSTSIPFRYIWMNAKKPCLKMLLFHSLFFPFPLNTIPSCLTFCLVQWWHPQLCTAGGPSSHQV